MNSHDDDDSTADHFNLTVHDDDRPPDALRTEYLGHYATLDEFLRAAVDTLVLPEGQWLLGCLDLGRVRACIEAGGHHRLRVDAGRVFLDTLRPAPPPPDGRGGKIGE